MSGYLLHRTDDGDYYLPEVDEIYSRRGLELYAIDTLIFDESGELVTKVNVPYPVPPQITVPVLDEEMTVDFTEFWIEFGEDLERIFLIFDCTKRIPNAYHFLEH